MEELNEGKAGGTLLTVAGGLLALLWVASMSVVDGNACTAVPACMGLAAVLLLAVVAMVMGQRPARPTPTFLLGLGAGLYFLLRCAASDSVVEVWREQAVLLGAFVFYGAGWMFARRRGSAALSAVLAVAVLVNILYFFLMRNPDVGLEWAGRPTVSLVGENTRGVTLFVYKNFAGIFLMLAGAVLLLRPLWVGWRVRGALFGALVGLAGMVCACFCGTRAVLLMLPLLLLGGSLLGFVIRLYSGKNVGWLWPLATGLTALVALIAVCDLFLGNTLVERITSIDTHLRTQIWRDICRVAPDAPWYGYGTGASQWMIVPIFHEWQTPNFAHNEYLQAWCDYGVVGAVLMLLVLVAHLSSGFWKLASEELSVERRVLTAMAMLLLAMMACCAVVDFVWHSFALAGMTAFACGVLASPAPRRDEPFWHRRNWAKGSRPPMRPVRVLGKPGSALACMGCIALASACLWLGWRLCPAWQAQWEYNEACRNHAPTTLRRQMLLQVMPEYPDAGIADHYVMLPREGEPWDWRKLETLLRLALKSNPRQLFVVTMLVDTLDYQDRYAEAEALMREKYLPGGQRGTMLTAWPAYYAVNLLRWGKYMMAQGELEAALSMMSYALRMEQHTMIIPDTLHRPGRTWEEPRLSPRWLNFLSSCRADVRAMRAVGVEPDDSWQQAMYPGGPTALYARWGKEREK